MILATIPAEPPPTPPPSLETNSLVLSLVGMMLVVGILCGVIYLIARKMSPFRTTSTTTTGPLRHVDSVRLDRRCALHLIEAGDQIVVVGMDSGGMQMMVVLNETFDEVLQQQIDPPSA